MKLRFRFGEHYQDNVNFFFQNLILLLSHILPIIFLFFS